MNATINGTTMPTLLIELAPGENVYCQTHAMAWMTDNVQMDTNTGGGILAGIKRSLSGGTFFVTRYTAAGPGPSRIAFSPRFPGHILPFKLGAGESVVCRKETFLVAEGSVAFEIAFQQRLGASFFGGEGFILQRVTGPGTVWLDLSGEVVTEELAAGQRLLVHAGHVGIITPSVGFDIQRVRGVRNMVFGGEGIFLATLEGPGKAWLQSMPILNLAEAIARYLPTNEPAQATTGGVIGGVIGNLMRGQ
jgi:uncharacterized protein (TIGR00266 family)